MVELKSNGLSKIHNVRFYNLTPRSINYLAYNKATCKLAVSRTDASIEIWDMRYAGYLEKTILGLPQSSVEAIGWVGERLFSTGHTGELTEWDLKTLAVKQSVLLTGNAAWCLDVSRANDHVAVGTEEGYLNIFHVDEYGLNYVKIFDKQEGRIMCCRYNHTGEILVTGSIDAIRIWDVKTGHAIHRMATGRSENSTETIVWSLAVLKDLTIISGDSRGRITIWDGKIGAQVDTFTALKADVLSVAVNEDETLFSCSGIDPIIKMFALTAIKKDNQMTHQWVKFIQRAVHDHDIKALTFAGTNVLSGGIDGYLGISTSSKSKQDIVKYGPFLPQPCAVVAETNRLLLLKYFDYLEVWRLGTPTENVQLCEDESEKGKFLSLEKGLEKLLELRSKGGEPIVSTAISPDSEWLAYSTENTIRLFRLKVQENGPPSLVRVAVVPEYFSASLHIRFSSDSRKIFLAKRNGFVNTFSLTNEDELDFNETIDTSKVIKDTITMMIVSNCGTYLVCAGSCCNIAVFKASKKSGTWSHLLNLPKYKLAPTAIAIHQNSPKLVAAFSDSKIFEYHLEEMRFTCSSNKKHVANTTTHAVNNVVLDPNNEDIILLHNDTYLYVLEKTHPTNGAKVSRFNQNFDDDDGTGDAEVAELKLRFQKHYEHFVHLSRLSATGSEMVAVGVNPVTLIEQLPPTMRQKRYGAS